MVSAYNFFGERHPLHRGSPARGAGRTPRRTAAQADRAGCRPAHRQLPGDHPDRCPGAPRPLRCRRVRRVPDARDLRSGTVRPRRPARGRPGVGTRHPHRHRRRHRSGELGRGRGLGGAPDDRPRLGRARPRPRPGAGRGLRCRGPAHRRLAAGPDRCGSGARPHRPGDRQLRTGGADGGRPDRPRRHGRGRRAGRRDRRARYPRRVRPHHRGPRPADRRRADGRRAVPAQRGVPHRAGHRLVPLLGPGEPLLAAPAGEGRIVAVRGREVQLCRGDPLRHRAGTRPGHPQAADPQGAGAAGPLHPRRGTEALHGHQAARRAVPGRPGHRVGRRMAAPGDDA